jgi:cytochrome c2
MAHRVLNPRMRLPLALLAALLSLPVRAALAPTTGPAQDDDLRISGLITGIPEGSTRYLSRAALLSSPAVVHLNEKPADSIAAADLTVLPIDRLVEGLPLAPGADAVLFICSDHWVSTVPIAFLNRVHPYLLLKYAGRTPAEGWPRFGPFEGLAPYYCHWSPVLGPEVNERTEDGEFDATQIIELRAVNLAAHFAPFYQPKLAALSPPAQEGRKLFIRECNNCHQGPDLTGGNVSQRPFSLLQVHAALNTAYFRSFVRNPRQFYPNTVMPTHAYFTEPMMDNLIAFLSQAKAAGVN